MTGNFSWHKNLKARVALICVLLFAVCGTGFCEEDKVSAEFQGGVGGLPPIQDHRAQITVSSTDAAQRTDSRFIKGQSMDGDPSGEVAANSITLTCNGTTVNTTHSQITMTKDDNTSLGYFPFTPFSLDTDDVALIAPSVTTAGAWCTINIQQTGGSLWTFPYGFRIDEQAPDVTTASNLITYPITGLPSGMARWSWSYSDSSTPGDPNGEPTTCPSGDSACNRSDERYQYQIYNKKKTDTSYPLLMTANSGPSSMSIDDDDILSTLDRFLVTDTSKIFCYTLRVEDTAGNFSSKASGIDEKCFVPDGKKPVFDSVKFYSDAALTKEFPRDVSGNYTLTSNPCYFDTATCSTAGSRYIYVKFTFSEPLFDGQFWGGYTSQADDMLDNDNDGKTDGTDETGGYNNLDDDADGFVDEDVSMTGWTVSANVANDKKDNDGDGYVDEEPNGANGKDDDGDGRTDEDTSSSFCAAKYLWNQAQQVCYPSARITIQGPDIEGFVPGSVGTNNYNDLLTWQCTAWGGNVNSICSGYATGTTVYMYRWEVTGNNGSVGLEEGEYEIELTQGKDAVGNDLIYLTPTSGGKPVMDNSGPSVTVQYFSNSSYSTGLASYDHDGSDEPVNACGIASADTPKMSVSKEGKLYIQVALSEYSGATPTVTLFTPDNASPEYCGVPQQANMTTLTAYSYCGQSAQCDPCTGLNCSVYDPVNSPCMIFRACYDVASTTVFNGYTGVSVWSRDRLENMKWDPDNAHADASQEDADGLSDDSNGDGIPTYIPGALETDAAITSGQNFGVDYSIPGSPAMGLPITPCDGTIARSGQTCASTAQTTKSPMLTWTRLSNNADDDDDTSVDEETYDGADNDADGRIDEDCVAPATGTAGWAIRGWHLQVATDPSFSTATMVLDDWSVAQANVMLSNLPERSTATPYYWRVSGYDIAGNEGPYSPASGTHTPYYTFGIDITPPQVSVQYYSDSGRTTTLVRNDVNTPITKDTASDGDKIYVTLTVDDLLSATPTFRLRQQGATQISDTTTINPLNNKEYYGEFEVDAQGGGQKFVDGLVDFQVYAVDLSGNTINYGAPATGSQFFVDTTAPTITSGDITAEPNPASMDNDGDAMPGEITEDAVTVKVQVSEYLKAPFKVRVKQYNFPDIPDDNDTIDNDCDGKIDEELEDGMDNDLDGRIDEDFGTLGALPGSGCFITMTPDGVTPGAYTGKYNVFPGYDGKASITVGDSSPASPYAASDYAGNTIYASASFTIDTTAPEAPSLVIPLVDKHVSSTSPLLGWQMTNRSTDLAKYRVQVDTTQGFASPVVDIYQTDDGVSTTFYYTIPGPLAEGKYYWRAYTYDKAQNRSPSSVASAFYVDTLPPSPPKFDGVPPVTVNRSSPLSGTAEANSQVEIYVNGIIAGIVAVNSSGVFTVGIDDDGDGLADEDVIDAMDNDLDGKTDEDPPGIFLSEGDNVIEGRVIDSAGNYGTNGCDAATPFYNAGLAQCILTLDSGAPTFKVLYFSNPTLTTPLPFNVKTNRFQAKAGSVYLRIIASEDLPSAPTYSVNQQGTSDTANALTSSINGSAREFTGTYTVFANTGGTYLDGDAQMIPKGTDAQGNTTPASMLPTVGAIFNIDTSPSTYTVQFYSDINFNERLLRDQNLLPNAKAGDIYIRIIASEPQSSAPKITIDQTGSNDIVDGVSTALQESGATSTVTFRYKHTVTEQDGSANKDGTANVSFNGTDLAGNQTVGAPPLLDPYFIIDTTAPVPPTLTLPASTTLYTQITATGTAEAYNTVEIFVRGNANMTADDSFDNDGDGRIDEEPANGLDDDNDMFTDEDTTAQACAAGKFWDYSSATCANKPVFNREPNGTDIASAGGTYSTTISNIKIGKNLIYTRGTDFAGNVGELSTPQSLTNEAPLNITLFHEFPAGWNLVGIPMQPTVASLSAAAGSTTDVFRLQSGVYKTQYDLAPMSPGACYWINLTATNTTITLTGITSTTRQVRLVKGWNMAALPYNNETQWDATVIVKIGSDEYPLGAAAASEAVEPYLYLYDPATGAYSSAKGIADNVTLKPWIGFIVKAKTDCYLVFPEK